MTFAHPLGSVNMLEKEFHLNRAPFGMPGIYHTICPYSCGYNNLYKVNHGASHRYIFDTGNWYHLDPFSKAEVERYTKYRMTFIPE